MRPTWPALCLLVLTTTAPASTPTPGPEDRAFFERSIRPLLVERCQACHSLAHKKQRGGLRLDSATALRKGGDSGPAVVPGQPANSLLIQSVRYDHATLQMPPKGKLADREIALLEEWVRRGAPFPGADDGPPAQQRIDLTRGRAFWSFQPLRTHPLPTVRAGSWPRTRIDAFLLAAMQAKGLTPAPEADRATLIRRLSFDLLGLPPTPEQVDAFVRDTQTDAYERLVDRLLASPHHGERWGRTWLDLVRYCDVAEEWAGLRGPPHLYRDWVVAALNADLPYDRFVQMQLAADLLPGTAPADRAALGYLGLSPNYWKELKLDPAVIKGVVAEEWEERIHTFSGTFLGLTVACARCHDHKSDPITQRDYYALAGVFASVREEDVPVGNRQVARGVVEKSLHVVADGPSRTQLLYKDEPQDVAVQPRGNPTAAGPVVPRRFLAVLSDGAPFRHGSGRLDLARALVGDGGPLLARVIVNRVWRHHFGEGIVRTPSDFGALGDRPTHPELLDDLAARFVANGWSLRWLHREIVRSAAYRQSSRATPDRTAVDPDNRLLSRVARRRLEVEAWRDAMLAATGTLRSQIGGEAAELTRRAWTAARSTASSSARTDRPVAAVRLPRPDDAHRRPRADHHTAAGVVHAE
ncbi:MAG: PSD1 and planctomycete cytochrome C domain-containing protein [Gemmataceae bacterium]